MTSKQIRQTFLDFFKSKEHQVYPSSPIVNKTDPSLLFINSGMNQFKDCFLGNEKPTSNRITDTQKCLRVSGKHNDLEEVGIDTYHHTMFEMLGNWSFGDYFKKEAIEWAWELLTKKYQIDPDNLYVTVFEGSKQDGLEKDQEAFDLWEQWIDKDRILNGSKKDNFWEMGEKGPCGPCSEIHIDIRTAEEKRKISGKELVNKDHPQVVEIWNLVFMEYNRKADATLEPLPNKHIDTGMGFERLCMVLQSKSSNYDTDVFTPIIREIETITGFKYHREEQIDIAIRVVCDHLRAVAFTIADGQLPSNNGAGYVIRRILRRAIRYYFTFLEYKNPLIHQLVPILVSQFKEVFPEIRKHKNLIVNVLLEEEQSFLKTLEKGLVTLDDIVSNSDEKLFSGEKAFELYDTFGFPIDLTELILKEKGVELDKATFEQELSKQKQRSRAAAEQNSSDWVILSDEEQEFIGYDTLSCDVKITKYREIKDAKGKTLFQLVFDKTPFYGESGGQVGDKGYLERDNGNVFYIIDTQKENNLILHIVENLRTKIESVFKAVVDVKQRHRTSCNHTATHLLHQALRTILGEHVEQRGSMVHSRSLRFDFSHFAKITDEELQEVEDFVNARIRESITLIEKRNVPQKEAMEGAMAIFGEKYGSHVRTIKFNESYELCGGTHVPNTNDIWHFIILSEGSISSGIRRIEAITKDAAKDHLYKQSAELKKIRSALKTDNPIKVITSLHNELSQNKKELQQLYKEKTAMIHKEIGQELITVNDVTFLAKCVDLNNAGIKDLAFQLGKKHQNLFLILANKQGDNKATITCYIDKNLAETRDLDANKVVKKLGQCIGGSGGGQKFFATAGGKNPQGIDEALVLAKQYISA